jgi:hypothetical protein
MDITDIKELVFCSNFVNYVTEGREELEMRKFVCENLSALGIDFFCLYSEVKQFMAFFISFDDVDKQ